MMLMKGLQKMVLLMEVELEDGLNCLFGLSKGLREVERFRILRKLIPRVIFQVVSPSSNPPLFFSFFLIYTFTLSPPLTFFATFF